MEPNLEEDDSQELVDLSEPVEGLGEGRREAFQEGEDKVSIASDKSEYETGSEWNPDFHSDNEPPQDQVQEERLLIKNPSLRIFKKIIRLGQRGDMPSKYNLVKYRFLEKSQEDLTLEDLVKQEI